MTSPPQARCVRQAIVRNAEPFKHLCRDTEFKKRFTHGFDPMTKATRCPRGFDAHHPDIEWIKLKTFSVSKVLSAKVVTSPELAHNVVGDFRQLLRLNALLQQAVDGSWSA